MLSIPDHILQNWKTRDMNISPAAIKLAYIQSWETSMGCHRIVLVRTSYLRKYSYDGSVPTNSCDIILQGGGIVCCEPCPLKWKSLNNWLTYIQPQSHSKDDQLSILQGLVRLESKNTKSEHSKPHNDTMLLCGDNATSSVMLWGKHRHCPSVSPPVFTICLC